ATFYLFSIAREVAALPPDEAETLLDWCEETPKPRSTRELRGEVSRRRVKIGARRKSSAPAFPVSPASRLRSPRRNSDESKGAVLRRDFDRGLNREFHGSRIEPEGISM